MTLEEYKKQLHKNLIDSYFSSNNTVSGQDILDFTPERQINLMIIYLLMEEWESEMERNKSPYFNYDNEVVKSALKSYMNTLSKHIRISKENFEPLLEKAITLTIQLVENPESFVVGNKLENRIPKMKKYIQYHKPYFEGDLDYEVNSKLQLITESLKEIVVFTKEESVQDIVVEVEVEKSAELPIEEKEESFATTSIHERLSESLNTPKTTLADKLSNGVIPQDKVIEVKIESIKNAISINQRFVFTNALFGGSTEQYIRVVDRLDACKSENEAKMFLKEELQSNYEKEEANQFKSLIEQKFNIAAK